MRNRKSAEQAFLVDYLRSTNTKLKEGADDGILRIVEYGYKHQYSIAEIAYNLATAGHETADWYQPIREGATRYGPKFTDAQSRAAVRNAMQKGLINLDYVSTINGRSYYGRGLVQITWLDNYKKYEALTGKPLVLQPDLVLEWETALFIMYDGITNGRFRKHKFSDFVKDVPTVAKYAAARNIVNGDGKLYGLVIAQDAMQWYKFLKAHDNALRSAYEPKSVGFLALLVQMLTDWIGRK